MVGISAGFGYLLTGSRISPTLLFVISGTFLLACGAATLNSIQERASDGNFERTRNRPLVTGTLSLTTAAITAALLIVLGAILLAYCDLMVLAQGMAALVIYNLIYTPLKRVTEFALIPGGISGTLPPLMGWTAAGGNALDPLIWGVMMLFFLWQPPHFCLVILSHRDDLKKQHPGAHLASRFSSKKIKRIIAVWMIGFTSAALFCTALPGVLSTSARAITSLAAPFFLVLFLLHLFRSGRPRYKFLFISLNSFLVCLMLLLSFGSSLQAG